ncbi:MAG: hypothetical protein WBW06_23435, partial [Xanthobacteraceae bacterium]
MGAVAGASYGKFGLAPITPAAAEPAAPPKLSPDKWWPSKWGADDQAGASKHLHAGADRRRNRVARRADRHNLKQRGNGGLIRA